MMECRECGGNLRTKDTRKHIENPDWVKRRRKCDDCGAKMVTLEIPREDLSLEYEDVPD